MGDHSENHVELDALLKRLRPFQREAFDFTTRQTENGGADGRLLLADEMGLGKTVTSLASMLSYKSEWPLLILCPASLRYTWPAEIEKWIPKLAHSSVYVVKGFDDCDFYSNPNKRSSIKIVVATYSLLQKRSASARALQEFSFKCVIADESHNMKDKSSQRCQLAMPLLSKAKRVILLSGTPALAKPVELWAQLHCINKDLFGSYTSFTKKYCNARRGRFGWDVSGLSNADELHEKLKTVMMRRLKADVLTELPSKQRSIVPVKIQKSEHAKECRRIIQEMNEARVAVSSLVGDDANNAHFEARSLMMQAYQASGIGKAQATAEYVLDWLRGSGSQKVLVFAHHIEVLDTIEAAISKHLKGVGHIRIDGSVNAADRAARVRKFQNKASVRVGLLSVTAAGVGLTLTAASSVIFAELHWTPGVLAQAEDRCHRIGQTNAVNIMFCVCKDPNLSVDLSLWKMLGRKVSNLGRMIDGKKGASMNAIDAENGAPSEQELSSFFAETCPTDTSKSVLVKGSIQSFFSKRTTTKKDEQKNSPDGLRKIKQSNYQETSLPSNPFTKTTKRRTQQAAPQIRKPAQESQPESVPTPWTCTACTFMNEGKRFQTLGKLVCEMCKTSYPLDEIGNSNMYSPKPGLFSLSQSSEDTCETAEQSKPSSPPQIEVIEICDDSDEDIEERPSKRSKFNFTRSSRNKDQPNQLICLDLGDPKTKCTEPTNDARTRVLSFSVSKNSGRIAIYDANTDASLLVNFDVENLIHESTSEVLLKQQLKRSRGRQCGLDSNQVLFEDNEVKNIAEELYKSSQGTQISLRKRSIPSLCMEIKEFIKSYLPLREIDKKAIQEWDSPIKSNALRETLRQIVQSSASLQSPSTTDRYSGGSKERALENLSQGIATDADHRVLNGEACIWCGGLLPSVSLCEGVESFYCSHKCATEGRLRRGGIFASKTIRSQLFTLESGVCQLCHVDANALFLRISALQPAERLNALMNANWTLPKSSKALQNLLQNPKEGDFWQADHIKAVAEGGGSCGLENLRTLCTPCHQQETEKLRSRLKLKGPNDADSDKSGFKSRDIRTLFANQKKRTRPSAD